MKKPTNADYSQLKRIANKISLLIQTGKWEELSASLKKSLTSKLMRYYDKVKQLFSKRKLSRALGASYMLLAGTSAIAQNFAAPDTNAFNLQASDNYVNRVDFVDIDGDGDLDVFSNGYYGIIRFQENTGTVNVPNFDPIVENPFGLDTIMPEYTFSCVLADIDADGDQDLFVSGDYGSVLFFENVGTSTSPSFGPEQVGPFSLPGTNGYFILSDFADIDGDGDLDLIGYQADYYTTSGFAFLENTGTPTAPAFASPVVDTLGITSSNSDYFSYADFADLDLDGDLDMISTEYYGAEISYHENIGTATAPNFAAPVSSPFNIAPLSLGYNYTISPTFVDIDGDGDQDIVMAEYYNNLFYYENIQYQLSIDKAADNVVSFEVYPNPTNQLLNFSLNSELGGAVDLKIMAIDGKLAHAKTVSNLNQIDVSFLENGAYIIEILAADHQIFRSQFIKQ